MTHFRSVNDPAATELILVTVITNTLLQGFNKSARFRSELCISADICRVSVQQHFSREQKSL